MTGFRRTGSCEVPDDDTGNHSVLTSLPLPLVPPANTCQGRRNPHRRLSRLFRRARQQPALHQPARREQVVSLRRPLARSHGVCPRARARCVGGRSGSQGAPARDQRQGPRCARHEGSLALCGAGRSRQCEHDSAEQEGQCLSGRCTDQRDDGAGGQGGDDLGGVVNWLRLSKTRRLMLCCEEL